jgi:hypothetical protein
MNWYFIILAGRASMVLIVFLVKRNIKDEVKFEDQLKEDYHKSRETDINDTTID